MKRLLGLDYGSKTVGVAVSDALGMTVQPLETIERKDENKLRQTLARISLLCADYDIQGIVCGLPYNMDGSEGLRAQKTREFISLLEKRISLPIILWDERLTSIEASEILNETGVAKSEQKKFIDQVAAALILEDYIKEKGLTLNA